MEVGITRGAQEGIDMIYLYLLFGFIAIAGVIVFLKFRKKPWWVRGIGLFLFGGALIGLFLAPAIWRQLP